jgi:hypothetical protein
MPCGFYGCTQSVKEYGDYPLTSVEYPGMGAARHIYKNNNNDKNIAGI